MEEVAEAEGEDFSNDSVDLISRDSEDVISLKGSRVTVEPMIFGYVIAIGTIAVTMQSFIINSICEKRNLRPNATHVDCNNLTEYKEEEAEVQVEAVEMLMYNTMIQTSLYIFYSLFLGEWIKRNGCKFTIVVPLIGLTIGAVYLALLSQSGSVQTPLILLASIPVGLSGGSLALSISSFSYITRITTTENRSFRLAMLEGTAILGGAIGLLAGAEVLKHTGFAEVFMLCGALQCFSLLYAIFFIENDGPSRLSFKMFKDLCNLKALRETVGFCIRKRDGSQRMWLSLLYLALAIRVLTQNGLGTVLFLLTRLRFGWSSFDFTNFVTADSLLAVLGVTLFSIVGIKVFKLRDTRAGVLGALSSLAGSFIWIFARAGWMPYLASVIQIFGGTVAILIRSILSKLVSVEETGTVFVVAGIIETVIPLGAAPLYGLIYAETLNTFSSSVIFVSVGGNMVILLIFLYLAAVMPLPVSQTEHVINSEPSEEDHTE